MKGSKISGPAIANLIGLSRCTISTVPNETRAQIREEYGFVSETVPYYTEFDPALRSAVSAINGIQQMPPVGWPDWNNGLGAASRFIYPPWLYGFPIDEWTLKSEPGSIWDRLTGAAVSDWVEPFFGQPFRWLLT